ncbi:hypothetical protein KU893_00845 [Nocardioides daeguensis]|uniref:Ig-like domain-containing protein n=1 Tax=Nocardioides daeguensis TaxID=908359 RepID=UPI001C44873A|nr:Ig-like domain-containing protein [Nocardioides daeguensis]MBV6725622.1 hypothetical protein [Nocardioides daeguensis]
MTTAAAFAVVLPPTSVQAAPLPARYAADAHADLVSLQSDLVGNPLANVYVGHSQVQVDSNGGLEDPEGGQAVPAAARVHAESSNVDVQLLSNNPTITTDSTEAIAPPPADPAQKELLDVPLGPIADVGLLHGDVSADYVSDGSCPALVGGSRVLGTSRTDTAGVSLLGVPGLPVANVGETRTELVDVAGAGDAVRSTAVLDVAPVHLLGGLVTIKVASPVVITAESDGVNPPTVSSSNPTAQVFVAGLKFADLTSDGASVPINVPLALVNVSLNLALFQPTATIDPATRTASLDLGAVLGVDLNVSTGIAPFTTDIVDLHLGVGQMGVTATAPAGGVECATPAASVITAPTTGATLTDATPTITGTAQPGSTVTLVIDGGTPVQVPVDNTGHWTHTPTTDLADGSHTVSVDGDANGAGTDDTVTFTIDTGAASTDTDGDGIPDSDEAQHGTDPNDADTDDDGLDDGEEISGAGNEFDGAPTNPTDPDSDDDGLLDGEEAAHATDPNEADTDGGSVNDGDEVDHGTDPLDPLDDTVVVIDATVITAPGTGTTVADATPTISGTAQPGSTVTLVIDGGTPVQVPVDNTGHWTHTPTTDLADGSHTVTVDGDANGAGTDDTVTFTTDAPGPGTGAGADTDGDGIPDSDEAQHGTDPKDADTDDDGLTDGQELSGATGCVTASGVHGPTDPRRPDTDGDGLSDGKEVNGTDLAQTYSATAGKPRKKRTIGLVRTNPCLQDTDGDLLTDLQEVKGIKIGQRIVRSKANGGPYKIKVRMTDPTRKDTDGDGLSDYDEVTGAKNKRFKKRKSDPTVADTDWGGGRDGQEVRSKHDPSRHG